MRFHPTQIHKSFLWPVISLLTILLIIISCSKDPDILDDAIFEATQQDIQDSQDDATEETEETTEETTEEETEETTEEDSTTEEETPEEEPDPKDEGFESRTTVFPPLHDAHVQSGKGFNQEIMRLEDGHRVSYLMFDLSPIDSIGGRITAVTFRFTVKNDDGDGIVNVFKAKSSEWTETNLSDSTAPEADVLLGSIEESYAIGTTKEITLSAENVLPELATLIVDHEEGNDLAFASKEHPSEDGPQLIVVYDAPEGAEEIVITEEDNTGGNEGEAENMAPMAEAKATPDTGSVPLEVQFNGGSSTDDAGIASYLWDFADGTTSTKKNPAHTFDEVGVYEVSLTVEDEEGLADTETITITVNSVQNEAPVASASADPREGAAPLEVSFEGSASTDDNEITRYIWNFKDGTSSNEENPTHTFTQPGTYNVKLTVRDEEGLENSDNISITVTAPANDAPTAVANASPKTGEAPLTVNFKGHNSTDDKEITEYSWNFGLNNPSSVKNPSRTFNTPGIYEVELTVTDEEGLTDSDTVTITVEEPSGGNGGGGGGGSYPPGAVLASSFGYNANNATQAFQDAIKSNNDVIVIDKQNNDWIIEPSRFFDIRNKTIIFEQGVVLRAKTGAYGSSTAVMFNFYEPINLTIEGYGATLKMNRNEYPAGEFRHALKIDGGRNITIKGLTIKDAGGDGININTGGGTYSENITIEDVLCTNNRRQGMTVISAQDMWVRNSTFSKSNGRAPEAGVDLEPSNSNERLVNINFINCTFKDNNSAGFVIGPHNLNANSMPISVVVKNSEFSDNAQSNNLPRPSTEIRLGSKPEGVNVVKGTARFENITFNGSRSRIIFSQKPAEGYTAIFKNCNAYDVVKSFNHNPIFLEGKIVANSLGGFEFDNFYIEYTRNVSFLKMNVPETTILKNINGTFTIKEPNDNPIEHNNRADPDNGVNVNIDFTHIN